MKRVVILGTELAPVRQESGALERASLHLARSLREEEPDVEAVCLDTHIAGGPPTGELRRLRPDLVVLNNRPLWAESCPSPVLHVLHNYPDAWGTGSASPGRVRAALERGLVAAVSPTLARHVEAAYRPARGVREARVGVEECFFEVSWEGAGGPVLFPNRLLEKKGVRHFLALASELSAAGISSVLFRHLAPWRAPTEEHRRLIELVESAGGAKLEEPPRTRREMAEWYARAGVVVCPSAHPEGLGLVALEAQAVGAPLVTSGRGGLADVTFPPNVVVEELEVGRWRRAVVAALEKGPSPRPREQALRYRPELAARRWVELVQEAAGL